MASGRSQRAPTGDVLPPAYDELNCGIVLHAPTTGAICDINDRLATMMGYSAAAMRSMSVAEFSANTYADGEAEAQARIEAAAAGTPQDFDWRVKRGDGRLIWVNVHLTPTTINDTSYVLGEITDITDYKHNDRRVSLFHRLLRHNLRNEITVITGYANHIPSVTNSETIEQYSNKIETAATGLSRSVESMKQIEETLTRDRSARTKQSALAAVADTVAALRDTHPDATISLSEHSELWVAVDDAFEYALTHAIENAIVHADSPEPAVEITIDESPNTGRVEIHIEDEAPPIPAVELDALDERATTTATRHGSGCGLFVMKWSIESLGGELRIDPAASRGNSVFFYLPPQTPPADTSESV
jgi:PAS domain S-box-containing protein